MTQQYDNELRGALFKNNKRTEERQPQYTGNVQVEGREYWLSAWVKESKTGTKFFSLSLTPKEQQADVAPVTPDVSSDEIPF